MLLQQGFDRNRFLEDYGVLGKSYSRARILMPTNYKRKNVSM